MESEKIIARLNEEKKSKMLQKHYENTDIYNGAVYICTQEVFFSEREIVKNKIKQVIPTSCSEISAEIKKERYPSEDAPEYIYICDDLDIDITMSISENDEDADLFYTTLDLFETLIKYYRSKDTVEPKIIITKQEFQVYLFAFDKSIIDGELYTNMYVMELPDNQILLGTISYNYDEKNDWLPFVTQMIESITLCI